jgi:hypothetical protein
MKIACLGWGSLIWDPRSVHIRSDWFSDGPLLPIEFARVSKDKRVTLVITPSSPLVRSLWALSSLDSVDAAKVDLALREGIKPEHVADKIGVWQLEKIDVNPEIVHWAKRLNLDAVLWTNLKPRFDGEERIATVDEIISHILHLSHEERSNAERYIRMAPKQIDTPYRRRMQQEFGWTPQASF